MNKLLIAFLSFVAFAQSVFGQTASHFLSIGDSLYRIKQYEKSFENYKKAIEMGDSADGDLYNAACSASLAGKKNEAFNFLNLSIKKGYSDVANIKVDSDLIGLHNEKAWPSVVARTQKNSDSLDALLDKPLQEELKQIYHDDQGIRQIYEKVGEQFGWNSHQADSISLIMRHLDSIDLAKVTKILDEKGWVGKDKVGSMYNIVPWLVIQHADLKTQEKYLPSMREAVNKGTVYPNWLALTEDRVALGEGKKQIYGSQIGIDKATGKNYVQPLEDPDNVDKRRAEVGLGPLAEYVKQWNIVWNVEEYKKQLPELEKKQNEK